LIGVDCDADHYLMVAKVKEKTGGKETNCTEV
jgi:hypothetical protein